MNVSNYKRRLAVTCLVVLSIGFSASFAMADSGMATLSDAVRPVAYQERFEMPPKPLLAPIPDAKSDGASTAVATDSGTLSMSSPGLTGADAFASACDDGSCKKTFVMKDDFKKFLAGCPKPNGVWVRTDYLLWWTKGSQLPPLVTTSSYGNAGHGAMDSPYTQVLYGNGVVNFANRSGIRASAGFQFDCGRAIEFDYLTLGKMRNSHTFSSSGDYTFGNPYLARPLINNETSEQTAEQVAGDPELSGRITPSQSEFFQSFGILFRRPICCPKTECRDDCCDEVCGEGCGKTCSLKSCGLWRAAKPSAWRIDFIGGWRNYRLEEWTTVQENLTVKELYPYVEGSTFDIRDSFSTQNEFNGADIGLTAQLCRGRWTVDLLAKVALGNQVQRARISGRTVIDDTIDPPEVYSNAGILALPSNIGEYRRDKFTAIPEFGAEVSCYLTHHLRAHVGYHLIYWPNAVRSGELIDLNVDLDQIPPAQGSGTRPAFHWSDSDYWAQGLNFGLEARF